MLSLCLNFKTKSTEANFSLLCYFRLITKKKQTNKQKKTKKKTKKQTHTHLSGGKYLENVLPLTSAVLSQIPVINT